MTGYGVTRGMTEEIRLCAAALFRILGKDVATVDEFVMEVSLGQKWFSPSEAKTLLEVLRRCGAVEARDGYVRPSGDLSGTEIPLGYRPPRDILETKCQTQKDEGGDPFPSLVSAAAEAGVQRREFIQESNRIHRDLGIDISAAALIALRDAGVDIAPHVERVRSWIRGSGITPS